MTDYGHDLHFGVFLTPSAGEADTVVHTAQAADTLGLDYVTVQDHPYQPAFLDTWTLLSVIAARTSDVTVLPNVANLPLRHPAVLARSAASLDILSNGRVELGLGAGAFWDAIEAMGGPRRTPGESVEALEEAIAVIRALWRNERTPKIHGRHYRLHGAKPGPFPVHDIGIWVGAYKKRMLRLTGRVADGWLPSASYAPPEQLGAMNAIIDAAAVEAGRAPSDIKRLYNISGRFGAGNGFPQGPAGAWAEQLAGLALDAGVSGFILAVDVGDVHTMQSFAEDVAPAVRELVQEERHGAVSVPEAVAPRADEAPKWEETARPRAPRADSGTEHAATDHADGQHLIQVHDHLRAELGQLRDLVDQVARGQAQVRDARSAINTMTMRQNSWTLGTYCESYCRLVTTHHTLEDVNLFPRLRRKDPRLGEVIDRLEQEHGVIAELLEDVDRALVEMVRDPDTGLKQVQVAVDQLSDTLLSHLSYEEQELVEPLSRFGLYGT